MMTDHPINSLRISLKACCTCEYAEAVPNDLMGVLTHIRMCSRVENEPGYVPRYAICDQYEAVTVNNAHFGTDRN